MLPLPCSAQASAAAAQASLAASERKLSEATAKLEAGEKELAKLKAAVEVGGTAGARRGPQRLDGLGVRGWLLSWGRAEGAGTLLWM